jgi:hypothetical protein
MSSRSSEGLTVFAAFVIFWSAKQSLVRSR